MVAEFSFTYRAFISYSHADHEWGVWLHRALERYRVPRRLAGVEEVRRLGKVFRDEEEMAAAHEIGPKVEAALKSSDVLIVICSPRSAKSQWVNREIEAFKKLGREHRVFALIVDGQPHSAVEECFPEALKKTLTGDGADPFAPDVRKFGREDAVLRLVAGMLDVGYDDLRQREVRRRRAEMLRAQAILITGLMLTAGALTGGWFAAANYVEASEKEAGLFAREADALNTRGQHGKAMLMALAGDPAAQAGLAERLLRPDGYAGVQVTLARTLANHRTVRHLPGEYPVSAVAYAPDGGTVLIAHGEGTVEAYAVQAPCGAPPIASFKAGDYPNRAVAFSPNEQSCAVRRGRRRGAADAGGRQRDAGEVPGRERDKLGGVLAGRSERADIRDGTTALYPAQGGPAVRSFPGRPNVDTATYSAFAEAGQIVFTASTQGDLKRWRIAGGAPQVIAEGHEEGFNSIAIAPGGMPVTGSGSGVVRLWPVEADGMLREFRGHTHPITSIAASPDGPLLLTTSIDGTAKVWSIFDASEPLQSYDEHEVAVLSAAFSPDGRRAVTGDNDGVAKIWTVDRDPPQATFGRTVWPARAAFSPTVRWCW